MELARRAEGFLIVRVIRAGLVNMIPILLIGAFSLVFWSFPLTGYQTFINSFAGGFIAELFLTIYKATFGVLSLYMTLGITTSYMHYRAGDAPLAGAVCASMIAFFILAGANTSNFGIDNMGPKSMFPAILASLISTALYIKLFRSMGRGGHAIYSRGADKDFNKMLATIGPILMIALIFGLFDVIIVHAFGVTSFRELYINLVNAIFMGGEASFGKGFAFILNSSVLWFFGIHGSDALEGVMDNVFVPLLAENQEAVANGLAPTNILTKQFFDCFVLMGGCGAMICLLISIFVFSKNQSRRRLGVAATLPMIFNINELMVFGLPIIYNPIMLVPFLLTPLVCYTTAYIATSVGLVPIITNSVEWTTPVLIGGYMATGSIAGTIMQIVNIAIGVVIYAPFVRFLDRQTAEEARRVLDDFVEFFKENESELEGQSLVARQDIYGDFARNITADLRHDFQSNVTMHYQPQYDYAGNCLGVEALLRWIHPTYGAMYPPILIKLAEDGGFLPDLEEGIMKSVLRDEKRVKEKYGEGIKISFNVTGKTVITDRFIQFCRDQNVQEPFEGRNLCIEVTEQATLALNDKTLGALSELRDMGLKLAIDDFSMGHTSIDYLKHNLFDFIKLDGSLVKGLSTHENCKEIISSIQNLAETLHMTVIAEYVETEEQREILREIGCDCYQGWLYSPARPLD